MLHVCAGAGADGGGGGAGLHPQPPRRCHRTFLSHGSRGQAWPGHGLPRAVHHFHPPHHHPPPTFSARPPACPSAHPPAASLRPSPSISRYEEEAPLFPRGAKIGSITLIPFNVFFFFHSTSWMDQGAGGLIFFPCDILLCHVIEAGDDSDERVVCIMAGWRCNLRC